MLTTETISIYAIPGINQSVFVAATKIATSHFGVAKEHLCSSSRNKPVVLARQFCLAMVNLSGYSTTVTGKAFNRDHATVVHAKKQIANLLETKHPRHDYNQLKHAIEEFASYYKNVDLSRLRWDEENND